MTIESLRRALGLVGLCLALCGDGHSQDLEEVTVRGDAGSRKLQGQVLASDDQGGLLLLAADGQIWTLAHDTIVERRRGSGEFRLLQGDDLARATLAELPEGFEAHTTAHYVICHNTSRIYAQWCGGLFERLYSAFNNYWEKRGRTLAEPPAPLVAVVFDNPQSFAAYARAEAGASAGNLIGYYSLKTNRIATYDLSGLEGLRGPDARRGSVAEINQILARPDAARTVATIIHEATHQLAFNSGLHARYADVPLWVSEGLAIYFETPDLQSQRGWRTIGSVNQPRLATFREQLSSRPPAALEKLLANDSLLRDPATAAAAYAEAWAWHYFLLRTRSDEYLAYTRTLSAKSPLEADTPDQRLADFRAAFGDDLSQLDAEFLRHMSKVR